MDCLKMSEKKKIVIVGGGIMGISTALHLIRRGCDVTIIEKEIDGKSASFGNASWLSGPSITPVLTPGAIYKIPKMLFSKNGPLFLKFPGTFKIIPWLLKYLTYSTFEKVNYINENISADGRILYAPENVVYELKYPNLDIKGTIK